MDSRDPEGGGIHQNAERTAWTAERTAWTAERREGRAVGRFGWCWRAADTLVRGRDRSGGAEKGEG